MASKQTEQTTTVQTTASPGSPTPRRLSLGALGGGNDGMGGPIYKVLLADPLSHAMYHFFYSVSSLYLVKDSFCWYIVS